MKKLEKISLIGLGAIGAAYGSKLHDMNPECLKVIADSERIERYSKNGFYINGKLYNFNYITPEEKCAPADVILVAVKYHDLDKTIEAIKNHVGPDTIILSLLNGISSEEKIGGVYGMDKMLYSICVAIDSVRNGNNINFTNYGYINFGEARNKTYSPKVQSVIDLFKRAGISYQVSDDMLHALWWKFMVNVGINQTSAVLKAPYRVFQEIKEASEFMEATMKEVIVLSQKTGINLNEADIDKFKEVLKTLGPSGKTSMLQDIEALRKTEVEMFAGTVCSLGEKYGVPTPINSMLFKMIHTLEQMN